MSIRVIRHLVLITFCASLTACGQSISDHNSAPSSTGSISRDEAIAYAREVNLRAGDLPLAEVYKPEREARNTVSSHREEACERRGGDRSSAGRIISRQSEVLGWTLHGELQRLGSAVEVLPSKTLMAQHNAANRNPRVFRCTSRYLRLRLARESSSRARLAGVTISRLPGPLPGIRRI
jgi:hypothetical protein